MKRHTGGGAPEPVIQVTEVTSLLRTVASQIQAPAGLRARRGALIGAATDAHDLPASRRFGLGGWGRARAVAVAVALTLLTAVGVGAATLADRWLGGEPLDDPPALPLRLPDADESPDDGTTDDVAPTPAAPVEPAEPEDADEPEDGTDAGDEPEDADEPEDGTDAGDEPEDAEAADDGAYAPDAFDQPEEESSADAPDDEGD